MDNEKMRELLSDVTGEGSSNCCGAAVYELGDTYICKDCKEHCEIEKDEEADRAFSWEQLATIERIKADTEADVKGDIAAEREAEESQHD